MSTPEANLVQTPVAKPKSLRTRAVLTTIALALIPAIVTTVGMSWQAALEMEAEVGRLTALNPGMKIPLGKNWTAIINLATYGLGLSAIFAIIVAAIAWYLVSLVTSQVEMLIQSADRIRAGDRVDELSLSLPELQHVGRALVNQSKQIVGLERRLIELGNEAAARAEAAAAIPQTIQHPPTHTGRQLPEPFVLQSHGSDVEPVVRRAPQEPIHDTGRMSVMARELTASARLQGAQIKQTRELLDELIEQTSSLYESKQRKSQGVGKGWGLVDELNQQTPGRNQAIERVASKLIDVQSFSTRLQQLSVDVAGQVALLQRGLDEAHKSSNNLHLSLQDQPHQPAHDLVEQVDGLLTKGVNQIDDLTRRLATMIKHVESLGLAVSDSIPPLQATFKTVRAESKLINDLTQFAKSEQENQAELDQVLSLQLAELETVGNSLNELSELIGVGIEHTQTFVSGMPLAARPRVESSSDQSARISELQTGQEGLQITV